MNKVNQACIELRHVSKIYRLGKVQVHALRDTDIQVQPGEFVGLVGPSGSGKTTMLNLVGCLDSPTSGEIIIDGQNVARLSGRRLPAIRNQLIGFVFQRFNLISVLTAQENVELPLMLQPLTRQERRARVQALLEEVGLKDVTNHRPEEMSGGEQQRVAIARALVTEPKIVLADEPTGNLDSITGGEILQLMLTLNKQRGITFLLATHDPAVMAQVHRLIQLKDGRVLD